jgi:hypothetical protein
VSVCDLWPNTALEPTPTALEFMDGLDYTTIIEFAKRLARRRGSALDR